VNNGTIYFSGTIVVGGAISVTVTGNMTLSGGGPVATETMNVIVGGTTTSQIFRGTVTCNGTSFDAKTLL
jgi:hypothetical protein